MAMISALVSDWPRRSRSFLPPFRYVESDELAPAQCTGKANQYEWPISHGDQCSRGYR